MKGSKKKRSEEASFLVSVFREKQENGTADPVWIEAALSSWPADKLSRLLEKESSTQSDASPFAAFLSLGFGAVGAASSSKLLSFIKTADRTLRLKSTTYRLEAALRVYRDLQSIRETDPDEYEEEIDHLFNDLVNDRKISG